jgi:hypothetical protein
MLKTGPGQKKKDDGPHKELSAGDASAEHQSDDGEIKDELKKFSLF